MQKERTKAALAATWVLAMMAVAYGGNTTSTSSWLALVSFTVMPPIVMWRFWIDPPQSLSKEHPGGTALTP